MPPLVKRSRQKLKQVRTYSFTGQGPLSGSYAKMQSVMTSYVETMEDVIGGTWPVAKRDKPLFRTCNVTGLTFLTARFGVPLNRLRFHVDKEGLGYSTPKVTQVREGYQAYPLSERATQAPQSRIDRGISEAVRTMRMGLNGDLQKGPQQNLLRAVCELKDTQQTVDTIVEFVTWIRDAWNLKKRGKNGARSIATVLTPSSSMRAAAQGYLTWKFGIKPTIDEVAQFCQEIGREQYIAVKGKVAQTRLEGSIETSSWRVPSFGDRYDPEKGRPLKTGTLCVTPWLTLPTRLGWIQAGTPYFNSDTDVGSWSTRPLGLPYQTGMNAVIAAHAPRWGTEYRGVVFGRRRKGWIRDERALLAAKLQWRNPFFKTAWDLVPCSFLWDWFLETGKGIEELDHALASYKYRDDIDDIWLTAKATPIVWVPVLSHTLEHAIERREFVQLGKTYSYAVVKVRAIWTIKRYEQHFRGGNNYFLRMPLNAYNSKYASGFGTPIVNVPVKAYQLSSGLALLLSRYRSRR